MRCVRGKAAFIKRKETAEKVAVKKRGSKKSRLAVRVGRLFVRLVLRRAVIVYAALCIAYICGSCCGGQLSSTPHCAQHIFAAHAAAGQLLLC